MSKSPKTTDNKIDEQIYRLLLRADFQEDLKSLRAMAGIPPEGLNSEEEANKWLKARTVKGKRKQLSSSFYSHLKEVLLKYGLPPGTNWTLRKYLIGNDNKYWGFISGACEIDMAYNHANAEIESNSRVKLSSSVEADWWRSDQPFVKVFIPQGLSLKDVQQYLKQNWPEIKEYFAKYPTKKRIRRLSYKERDSRIFELSKLSLNELNTMSGFRHEYKDMAIAAIMKREGFIVSSGNVKMIITRQKKLRSL